MARIQILELPSVQLGEYYQTPFIVVIDQVETGDPVTSLSGDVVRSVPHDFSDRVIEQIKAESGAATVIVTAETLDQVRD